MFYCTRTLESSPGINNIPLSINDLQFVKKYFAIMRGNQLPVSAARWQHWSPDMFCNFYLVKNQKIASDSATTEAREKMRTDLESLEF
jgi:hypothetical protein